LIRLRAKFGDFGAFLRAHFDAGTAQSAITIDLPEAERRKRANCIQKRISKKSNNLFADHHNASAGWSRYADSSGRRDDACDMSAAQ
jgi:cation transport regulator ChaB